MKDFLSVLSREEKTAFSLRLLYAENGFAQYKMSKFEEYDLYVKNKDFLVSENVITFTDTDGKLLALKPDVTLSIIKNSKDNPESLMQVYYNENVYRVSKGTKSFKEIMQVGLECIGNVDDKAITRTLYLAAKSLDEISPDNVLEVSNLDIVSGVIDHFALSESGKKQVLEYLGQKNEVGVEKVCNQEGLSLNAIAVLKSLVTVYGKAETVVDKLDVFRVNPEVNRSIDQLSTIIDSLKSLGVAKNTVIDFSVVNDMSYYNGIAFKGFIEGIPTGILSGGEYDGLMKKMKRKSRAIGFAVYLDEISRL